MALYYVDETNGNDNTGTGTTGAPWKTMTKAATVAAAGDIIYGGGTEVLTTAVVFTNSGTIAAGYIRYIACTIAGSVWTPSVGGWILNGNSAAANCISMTTKNMLSFEGIEFKNATSDNVACTLTANLGQRFIDCSSHNSGRHGFYGAGGYGQDWLFERCKSYTNTGDAFSGMIQGVFIKCEMFACANGYTPYSTAYSGRVEGCIVRNMTTFGLYAGNNGTISKCVIDNCLIGITVNGTLVANGSMPFVLECTITNCSLYGIRAGTSGQLCHEDYNYFFSNGSDISVVAGAAIISIGGSLLAQSTTPYVTPGSDFTRKQGTGLRFTDLLMPGGVVHQGITAGLPIVPNFPSTSVVIAPNTVDTVAGTAPAGRFHALTGGSF